MEFRHVVSVTGIGGLYQLLSTKATGAVIRNLADKSTRFISARQHQVTPLESIEIYTQDENVPLYKVLEAMKEQDELLCQLEPNKASTQELAAIFRQAIPHYDEDRVYASDIKKIMKWYQILKKNELLDFSKYTEAADDAEEATAASTPETTSAGHNEEAMVEEHQEDALKGDSEIRPNAAANKKAAKEGAKTEKKTSKKATEEKPKKTTAKKESAKADKPKATKAAKKD